MESALIAMDGEENEGFSSRPCAGCTSSSLTPRLRLMRLVQQECNVMYRIFDDSDSGIEVMRLIVIWSRWRSGRGARTQRFLGSSSPHVDFVNVAEV